MADEPSNGELGRRLDAIHQLVQGLVGRLEYAEYQRALEHRLTNIDRDIEDVRTQHAKDIKDVRREHADSLRSAGENRLSWRAVVYAGLLPALLVLVSILVQIWLAKGHG